MAYSTGYSQDNHKYQNSGKIEQSGTTFQIDSIVVHILPKKLRSVISERRQQKEKAQDLRASSQIDVSQVQTLCLALGPYRNLTTLTASVLFLHPNCQVLNHGSSRILGEPEIDFLLNYDDERFNAFMRYAIHISTGGSRGKRGGSIVHSHAFDEKHKMGQLYKARFGSQVLKKEILSIFWKESLRTSQHIRNNNIDLDRIFKANSKLRFLLPIRHPIDCALSNMRTGHAKQFGLDQDASVEMVLEAVLNEFLWVCELEQKHPKRFFHFFENAFHPETVDALTAFLDLPVDDEWKQAALEAFDVDKHYQHDKSLIETYNRLVGEMFADYPEFAQNLKAFVRS